MKNVEGWSRACMGLSVCHDVILSRNGNGHRRHNPSTAPAMVGACPQQTTHLSSQNNPAVDIPGEEKQRTVCGESSERQRTGP